MKHILLTLVFGLTLLVATTSAHAGVLVEYPDDAFPFNSFSLIWPADGMGHVAIHVNCANFRDIYTIHTTHASTPLMVSLMEQPFALGYYLRFMGFTLLGNYDYDLYATSNGVDWYLVGDFVLAYGYCD